MAKKKKSIEFPATDAKFDVSFTNLMAFLAVPDPNSSAPTTNSYVRLGLNTTTQYNPLLAILGSTTTPNTWLYVYPLEKHKATRTGVLTTQKNTLKKKALAIIRPLRIALKAEEKTTPNTLSASDKNFFFIPAPAPHMPNMMSLRTAFPVPALSVHSVKHLEHFIQSHNPDTPHSISLPEGIQFIWVKRYIGTTAPTDQSQFAHLLFSGKYRHLSSLPTTNVGQTAWYTACYISTTGETGDWSPFINATIGLTA